MKKGYIDLIHADKGADYAMMKADSWALGILLEGLRNSIQKYEGLEGEKDKEKLAKINEVKDSIVYIRQSCINE